MYDEREKRMHLTGRPTSTTSLYFIKPRVFRAKNQGSLSQGSSKSLSNNPNFLTFETTILFFFFVLVATCDKSQMLIHLNTSNTPMMDQLNKTDHLPSCRRHELFKLWLEFRNRDILNSCGRSCLQAPEEQGDSL